MRAKSNFLRPDNYRTRAMLTALALSVFAMLEAGASPAVAAPAPAPHWNITSSAEPTVFAAGPREECEQVAEDVCDTYFLLATNIGSTATDGSQITMSDTLPAGVIPTEIFGVDWSQNAIGEPLECTTAPLQCTDERVVAPDGTISVMIRVEVTTAVGTVVNSAGVAGGGTGPAVTTEQTDIGAGIAAFAIHGFGFSTTAVDGSVETQAGAHPYEQSTSIDIPTDVFASQGGVEAEPYRSTEEAKNIVVTLPAGFLGNPQATPRCPLTLLEQTESNFNPEAPSFGQYLPQCPPASRVGVVSFASILLQHAGSTKTFGFTTSVYNVAPEGNHPAELGFRVLDKAILLYPDLIRTASGYRIRVAIPGIPLIGLHFANLTLFGQPGARNGEPSNTAAFVTNPARCSGEPLNAQIEADSWEHLGTWVSGETIAYPQLSGCELLQFNPEIAILPESTQADSPTGLSVDLKVPRAATPWSVLQSPQLRDATIVLPGGLVVSPAAAAGLGACPAGGSIGINIPQGTAHPDEAGPGEAIGASGLSYLTPGSCPAASTLGTVEIDSPLVPQPLQGHVYLGTPDCSPCSTKDAEEGRLLKLYIEAAGSGVVVKLPGTVSASPSGQLTAHFDDNPQLPFSDLRVHFKSGARAALATPPTCGGYTTTTDLKPWSAPQTPDAAPSSSFSVSSGPNGSACASSEAGQPNKPSFDAGTTTPIAGAFSPVVLKLAREDGSQRIAAIDTTLPKGLTGKLAGIPYCSEPQIAAARTHSGNAEKAAPSCPLASEVGVVNVGAGAGSSPYYVQGHAYLAGPYKGAPLSLAIITPAVAGPFDLGTVVVRTALYVNETTAQIHAVSDPIPSILAGIPLDIRSIALNMNRPNFTLNPTSCNAMVVLGSATSTLGNVAQLQNRFQVGACGGLGFKPSVALSLMGATKRNQHPALKAVVTYPKKGSYANIAKAAVTLPASEFIDNARIGDVCTRPQFAAGKCPPSSVLGKATAYTPLLDKPLTGKVYFRSNGGERELPDLVADLNGQIHVVLVGAVDAVHKKGSEESRVRSTFATVPDAPVSKFALELKGGKKGLLVNSGNLCKVPNKAVVKLTAQNGKTYDTNPAVANSCGKKSKKKHKGGRKRQ